MRQIPPFTLLILAAAFAVPAALTAQEPKQPSDLKKVTVAEGVELHYLEKGKGVPVVFVHGGGSDYTMWEPHLDAFAENYRAIAYSCRYNYPNTNKLQPNYSLAVAAEDLAGLIKRLELGKVHVVASSLGATPALLLAVKQPEMVRSLILCDPGVFFKGDPLAEARALRYKAVRAAFEKGNTEEALVAIAEGLTERKMKFDEFPEMLRKMWMRNIREFEAMAKSDVPADVEREALKRIAVPTLLIFGEKSPPIFKKIEEGLMSVLPEKNRKLVILSGASHGFVMTHAEPFRKEALEFLKGK